MDFIKPIDRVCFTKIERIKFILKKRNKRICYIKKLIRRFKWATWY